MFNSGLIIQWGHVQTNLGPTVFTMPMAVTTYFISVCSTQDWDDYNIASSTIAGHSNTEYVAMAGYSGTPYSMRIHWHAICI